MNPVSLIPTPDAIPVHWGWFKLFLVLTFFLHLLLMNTMLGIGIIALIRSLFTASGADDVCREIGKKLPFTIAFAVNMGVAPLLFIQVLYGQFIYTSSILMAVYWLSIIALLIIAYYSAYLYYYTFDTTGSARTIFIALSVVHLLVIAFFFTNNMTMMLSPEKWQRYFSAPGGMLLNMSDPTLLPRYLHFVLSAVAVGGLFLALMWEIKRRGDAGLYRDRIRQGLRWFTSATLLQFIVGSWWLLMLPKPIIRIFMGGNPPATVLFILGILGTVAALVFGFKGRVRPCTGATIFTIFSMVLMRDQMRTAYLKPHFELSSLETVPQYGSLILFLVALVVGAAAIVYMLRIASRGKKEVRS